MENLSISSFNLYHFRGLKRNRASTAAVNLNAGRCLAVGSRALFLFLSNLFLLKVAILQILQKVTIQEVRSADLVPLFLCMKKFTGTLCQEHRLRLIDISEHYLMNFS